MQNFNLQVGTAVPKRFVQFFCQPITVVDQAPIWLFFEEDGQQSVIYLLEHIRAELNRDNREYGYSQENGCHTIQTIFQDFDMLVSYLQAQGFICRDNYGKIIKPKNPELEEIFGRA